MSDIVALENDSHDYWAPVKPGQVQTWNRNTTGVIVINKSDDPVGDVWMVAPTLRRTKNRFIRSYFAGPTNATLFGAIVC